ncbi:ABC transporter related protein [Stappia sp. 22II-S9-Z10]|nr:ABC transporter related protein [Stappia sp. 22II-S9-Z10]
MLSVTGLDVHYGPVHALKGVDIAVAPGSVTALLGANGAGKTTALMAIAGARPVTRGAIRFDGRDITGMRAEDIIRLGIGVVPEGRRVFASLTVEENLAVAGSLAADKAVSAARRAAMMERFPILAERRTQRAGLLSGGEQQMLAIARALMAAPRLLLLDEPSLGLAPLMVDRVFDLIAELKAEGLAMLLVEQNVPLSLEIADRVAVLGNGRVSVAGTAAELGESEAIRGAYMAA